KEHESAAGRRDEQRTSGKDRGRGLRHRHGRDEEERYRGEDLQPPDRQPGTRAGTVHRLSRRAKERHGRHQRETVAPGYVYLDRTEYGDAGPRMGQSESFHDGRRRRVSDGSGV